MSASKVCDICGKTFHRAGRWTDVTWPKARFCSRKCGGVAKSRDAIAARLPLREAFERWYSKTDGCWPWEGAIDRDGYGIFSYAKKTYRAPKVALALDGRPVAEGQYACHHCDNPQCVRPEHLYPGTPAQNMRDAVVRGRIPAGERNHSAKLTEDQVRAIRAATETHDIIAARFGVARATVSLVRERRTWRHVA